MNVGLFGFGRTGKLVAEEIIKDPTGHLEWVVRRTDTNNHEYASDFLGYPKHKQGVFYTMDEAKESCFFASHRVNAIIDIRVGGIVGKHEVVFGLPNQTIRISHDVIGRGAIGAGALFAARSLEGASNGFYTMEDLMRNAFIEKITTSGLWA